MASPMLLDRVKQKIIDSQRENCCLITACSYNELGQKFIYLRDLRVRAREQEYYQCQWIPEDLGDLSCVEWLGGC